MFLLVGVSVSLWGVNPSCFIEVFGSYSGILKMFFLQKYIGHIPTNSDCRTHQERLLLEIRDKLSIMLGGDEYVAPLIILPHNQNPGILILVEGLQA